MNTGLSGKVAVVTGAGQGIGRGIALALAEEGMKVVVADLNGEAASAVATEIGAVHGEAISVAIDVAVATDVEGLFARTKDAFGSVHVLVNNAGIYPFVAFENMSEADWIRVMDINMKGVFLCSKAAARMMGEGGRIVSVSSIASFVGFEGLVHYCASKGGVNGFTRALALELAKKRITVNAVAPGAIATPGASGAQSDEALQQMIALIPLSRQGVSADIAGAVTYLASDQASYVTGQVIVVDGGWTLR
ncbi:MAG: SDR family NAD(P)-dependent oxidoreductase [Candidatus Moraniibacteriota bacterium]|jgi:NAD(P)-dependent dehydrogenase (short-subunit alcohol dehydrogenase family)